MFCKIRHPEYPETCKIRHSDELKTYKIRHSSFFFLSLFAPKKQRDWVVERGEEKIEINLNIRNEQIKSFIGFRPKDYYGQDGIDSWYDYLLDHVLHSGSRLWRCCLSTSSILSERFWDWFPNSVSRKMRRARFRL